MTVLDVTTEDPFRTGKYAVFGSGEEDNLVMLVDECDINRKVVEDRDDLTESGMTGDEVYLLLSHVLVGVGGAVCLVLVAIHR